MAVNRRAGPKLSASTLKFDDSRVFLTERKPGAARVRQ